MNPHHCDNVIVRLIASLCLMLALRPAVFAAEQNSLYREEFQATGYGCIPDGWRDLVERRPSRNWAVDGHGFLRPVLKRYTGLLAYEGYLATAKPARALADASVSAAFKLTEDEGAFFGVAGRIVDRENHYLARLTGAGRLELVKIKAGKPEVLASLVTAERYREGECWRLTLTMHGESLTATVANLRGIEMARVAARDGDFHKGPPGICATTFAAAASFSLAALETIDATATPARLAKRNAVISSTVPDYVVVKPHWQIEGLNTPREKLASDYDVIIAGAGTGGWAAAIQAARMGVRVLLLEETDWIGGQMGAAAVTSMDEDSVWHKFPVRERGIYREFQESMALYYYTLDKDPYVAYYGVPWQLEGGYEPKAARAVLYGFIQEARQRHATLDVSLRSRVVSVRKQGDAVTGATVEFAGEGGAQRQDIACRVLIDATEYGDVIPLTGAGYRVGNVTSDKLDPAALVQDHTWTAVVREYPSGVPEHLRLKSPPPGYEEGAKRRYQKFQWDGLTLWGSAGKGIKGPRTWRVFFAWRGMADADSPLIGERSGLRHTQCGFNGGNDYPVTVATIEDPAQRLRDEREGIYKTLGALYYFQHELGVNWSLAEDEGYATPYNRAKLKALDLRPDLAAIAVHLPQQPYVRECRRIVGVRTLVATDLTRFEEAKLFPSSVAMGDYFMDLDHGKTAHAVEPDLDAGEAPKGGGPFQIPFEVFIPEKLDGFLPAEKNLSQSRLANGATRLQPVTILTGQAAGAIAALAVQQRVPPRALDVKQVQSALLDAGCTLIQRWHSDVPWRTPIWKATQLLSLYQVMDRPGPITKDEQPLAAGNPWGVNEPLRPEQLRTALARLLQIAGQSHEVAELPIGQAVSLVQLSTAIENAVPAWNRTVHPGEIADVAGVTAGEFALIAARILLHPQTIQAAESAALTAEEVQQIETAKAAVRRSPQMKEATARFNAARKLYQADRAKFPAERSAEVAVAFRKATKEFEEATRKAMLAQNPALAPLLEKADAAAKEPKRPLNDGETVADSDSLKNPAVRPIKDVPGLPRVLLIGDSISIGYTRQVRELLKGKANVHRIPVNGGATEVGLANMKAWLGDGRWDVIHFNFGLHDAKFASETTQRATREQYAANLRTLVAQMKSSGAKLIFATTTPVPKDGVLSPTRKFDSIPARNEIAAQVMKDNGVAINDLYTVVLPVQEKIGRASDVHFQPEGYELLAKAVASSIEAQITKVTEVGSYLAVRGVTYRTYRCM